MVKKNSETGSAPFVKDRDILDIIGIDSSEKPDVPEWFTAEYVLIANEVFDALEAAGRDEEVFRPAVQVLVIQYVRFMKAAKAVMAEGHDTKEAQQELQASGSAVQRSLRDMHMTVNGAATLKKPKKDGERDIRKFFAG